jgi:outer membrane protein TolC
MKDLNVLKKLLILFSIVTAVAWSGSDLQNYLSDEKNLIFNFQQQQSNVQSGMLQNSWISPVTVSYQKDWKPQDNGKTKTTEAFSIGIDQPIFKSGGIYFGIKYAQALRGANQKEIALQKRQLIAQATEMLFRYRKTKLQIQKLRLLTSNGAIAVQRQEEMYGAGMIDSTLLDQTILARNRDNAQLLDLELALRQLRANFRFLSDKNPDKLRLPKLKLISLKRYGKKNLKLAAEKLHAQEKQYSSKMTWTKYLPTVTAYARYRRTDELTPGTMKGYKNYGIRVSMPLSVNAPADIEASRLGYLLAQVKVRDQRKIIHAEYALVRSSLYYLDRKISLAKRDESLYRRLLKSTRNLHKAGEKTRLDVRTMENSLKMKKLDRRIYYIDKQLQMLKLYAKVAR